MDRPLTFVFMPESAYGPTNNCIGIADLLRRRGHEVVFAAESSWKGRLEPFGFEEDLVDLAPPGEADVDAGRFWMDFIRDTAPVFRLSTLEQLEGFILPTWQTLLDGARYCQPQLEAIVDRHRPDVVVEDNVCCFPALLTAGCPFVRIVSCNPLEMKGPGVPPTFSGYPSGDPTGWTEFRAEYSRVHRSLWEEFNAWVMSCGAPALPELEFMHDSPDANLYIYPEAVDYVGARPLGPKWHRLDSCVRGTDEPFELPETLRDRDGALVYLSLGSLGSADVGLMRRLVDLLSRTRHRYVVSKGPLADEYDLADNMCGAAQVPQTRVLELVDLVITHGGNNTTTECFHFGKPMVVLPLFWDQHDNAQRVHETAFGRRLATYAFEDADLVAAVDDLLADTELRSSLASLGAEIRARDGSAAAADVIEELGRTHAAGSSGPRSR